MNEDTEIREYFVTKARHADVTQARLDALDRGTTVDFVARIKSYLDLTISNWERATKSGVNWFDEWSRSYYRIEEIAFWTEFVGGVIGAASSVATPAGQGAGGFIGVGVWAWGQYVAEVKATNIDQIVAEMLQGIEHVVFKMTQPITIERFASKASQELDIRRAIVMENHSYWHRRVVEVTNAPNGDDQPAVKQLAEVEGLKRLWNKLIIPYPDFKVEVIYQALPVSPLALLRQGYPPSAISVPIHNWEPVVREIRSRAGWHIYDGRVITVRSSGSSVDIPFGHPLREAAENIIMRAGY